MTILARELATQKPCQLASAFFCGLTALGHRSDAPDGEIEALPELYSGKPNLAPNRLIAPTDVSVSNILIGPTTFLSTNFRASLLGPKRGGEALERD
jgi:hypothetical protein